MGLDVAKFGLRKLRVWFNGRTSAFQADDAGSIPATRSKGRLGRQPKPYEDFSQGEKLPGFLAGAKEAGAVDQNRGFAGMNDSWVLEIDKGRD